MTAIGAFHTGEAGGEVPAALEGMGSGLDSGIWGAQIGWLPYFEDFNTDGLEGFSEQDFEKVMAFNRNEWRAEPTGQAEFFIDLYDSMPKELIYQRELITARLA